MSRCLDIADVGAVALNIVIHEVMETGGSVARHPHEFGCERGRHQHPSEPLGMVLGITVDLSALPLLALLVSWVLIERASPVGWSQSAPTVPVGEEL